MARYYAALVRAEDGVVVTPLSLPQESYTAAINIHASMLNRHTERSPFQTRVLVDLGTVRWETPEEMKQILHDDPTLRAVFEVGRRYGVDEAENR